MLLVVSFCEIILYATTLIGANVTTKLVRELKPLTPTKISNRLAAF